MSLMALGLLVRDRSDKIPDVWQFLHTLRSTAVSRSPAFMINTSHSGRVPEQVTVIDLADHVVGALPRSVVKARGYPYRVTYILVFNRAGEILVQKRSDTKDWCPGLYDLAAGGIVQEGESYDQSAGRELEEELGVRPELTYHFELYYEDLTALVRNRNWGRVYSCVHEGPFDLQPEEVVGVEFMPVEQALALEIDGVTPDTRQVLMAYQM